MRSHEAIQKAINGKTVEHAKALGKSISLLGKWQEPQGDYTDSGTYNPLDRIETIVETALRLGEQRENALAPVYYLNQKFNLICIPVPSKNQSESEISKGLLKTVKEFGELASEAAKALEDGKLSSQELKRIDKEGWEAIKEIASFLHKVSEAVK